jgi:hypothetical protein
MHIVIIESSVAGHLSGKKFKAAYIVTASMPECLGIALILPPSTTGICEVQFDAILLAKMLCDLEPLRDIMLDAFSAGLVLT